jgi:hypothetical protein
VDRASNVVVVEAKPAVTIAWALLHLDKDIVDSGPLQVETYTTPFSLNNIVVNSSTGDVMVKESLRPEGVLDLELQISTEQRSHIRMSKIKA